MRKTAFSLVALIMIISLLFAAFGCAQPAPAPAPAPGPAPGPPPAPEVKTLKIGCLVDFGFPIGMDTKKELEAIVPIFNEKGGLVIGGERYNIDLIIYDSKMSAETGKAAVERLVHQDKVKFILGDETTDAWLPVTEENKVVVVTTNPFPSILSPDLKYVFQASSLHTNPPSCWGWFSENYPELKTVGAFFSDDGKGHAEAAHLEHLCEVFGQELLSIEYYPPDCTDFSAYATKLAKLNPDVYTTCAGGPVQDALGMKFLREAGWEGQIFLYVALSPEGIGKVIDLKNVEGALAVMVGTELPDPPPIARELKDAYVNKYGEWTNPVILHVNNWYCLIAALQKAQSLDPDAVAAVIGSGLEFDSPQAPAMMISRPDMGNPKTVDALFGSYIGIFEGGKAKHIHTITKEQALEYIEKSRGD
ncbi:hypothetical protein ES703_17747 [subsurface metagenome]